MSIDLFRKAGFSDYEARILSTLLKQKKPISAKDISAISRVPITKLYSLLIKLEKDGIVIRYPGKINLYSISSEFGENILKKKEEEYREKIVELKKVISELKKLTKFQREKPEIRYYVDQALYWERYINAVIRNGKEHPYRIINNIRLCVSYLPAELETNRPFFEMLLNDLKMQLEGMKIYYIVNVRSLLENTHKELKEKNLLAKSIAQVIAFFEKFGDLHKVAVTGEFENILVVILKDTVFFEFYEPTTSRFMSAIEIIDESIASDFGKWFENIFHERMKENWMQEFISKLIEEAERFGLKKKKIIELSESYGKGYVEWLVKKMKIKEKSL